MADSAPAPGWYRDRDARLRWWDGTAWGPTAPVQAEEESGRTAALLAHLGVIAGGFPLPLILRQTEGQRNRFVRHHATEALNFQLTFVIVWLAGAVAILASGFFDVRPQPGRAPSFPFSSLVVIGVVWLVGLANVVLSVLGCIRASRGEWWRYPVSIRFVRGARPATRRG